MSLTSKCDSCIHQDDCEDSSNHALMHVVDGCGDYECGAKVRTTKYTTSYVVVPENSDELFVCGICGQDVRNEPDLDRILWFVLEHGCVVGSYCDMCLSKADYPKK